MTRGEMGEQGDEMVECRLWFCVGLGVDWVFEKMLVEKKVKSRHCSILQHSALDFLHRPDHLPTAPTS